MTSALFIGLALLVGIVGFQVRRRLRARTRGGVTDDIVRQIEAVGRVDAEDIEPLDVEQARLEEDEFWAQTWDEPDDEW